jgi:hypothetical protein
MTCVTVFDNDGIPPSVHVVITVTPPTYAPEGNQFCWLVTLDAPVAGAPLTVNSALSGTEQAVHGYAAPSVVIPVGATQGYLCVQTTDDAIVEADLSLCLQVATSARITSVPAAQCVVVQDNDTLPAEVPEFMGGLCCTVEGPAGTTVQFNITFRAAGDVTQGTSCLPESVFGTWLFSGAASDYEVMSAIGDQNGHAPGAWYSMGANVPFRWTYTLPGSSGGRFVSTSFSIRRASDHVVVHGPVPIEMTQIGVNTECV